MAEKIEKIETILVEKISRDKKNLMKRTKNALQNGRTF
jgi:hypothetical protein